MSCSGCANLRLSENEYHANSNISKVHGLGAATD